MRACAAALLAALWCVARVASGRRPPAAAARAKQQPRAAPKARPWSARRRHLNVSVAHCIVGAARTLPDPDVYVPMRRFFIDGAGGSDVHIFAYLDLGIEMSAKGQWHPLNVSDVEPALEFLRSGRNAFVEAVGAAPRVCDLTFQVHTEAAESGLLCGGWPCTGQFTKWNRCNDMVRHAELERGRKFDWIIRSRPDNVWRRPAPPVGTLSRQAWWNVDRQLWLPREFLEITDSIIEAKCDGCNRRGEPGKGSCLCLNAQMLRRLIDARAQPKVHALRPNQRVPARGNERGEEEMPPTDRFQMFSDEFKRTAAAEAYLSAVGIHSAHGKTISTVSQHASPRVRAALAAVGAVSNATR
ncbi:hypothetical protein M885DRAFT_524111 [Pelagophyceae sp. CCMP2097]|nr:hypothetical protein M885DRAFT_524111 [Pelagophyceae sp. CCMP2097]|mmetsp:Transcript_2677/g.9806  ORF Transcript_2677/g.9806 Transcript_2677/m.9806 type:complete len:356 (-) Transcript_2677:68-1135(-)